MDMSDDFNMNNMHTMHMTMQDDVNVQQYQSILQPLLECQKTSSVGVGVGVNLNPRSVKKSLHVDTNITMDDEGIEIQTQPLLHVRVPRMERMSSQSTSMKKQQRPTSFNWDIDDMNMNMNMEDDNVNLNHSHHSHSHGDNQQQQQVVRTVSPLKSSGQKDEEGFPTRNSPEQHNKHKLADHEKNVNVNVTNNVSVWREKNHQNVDNENQSDDRYLMIANNVSQSSSELCG